MQTNCYIVENTKTNQAFVFDPGDQGERIMDTLKEDGMELAGVCLTHGHFDHVMALPYLMEKKPDLNVYLYGWLISGDTLFQMSIGRTDFPTGNLNDLLTAIREKLFVLPPWTKVLSGHTPPTTIEEESRCNPFLQ